MSYTTNHKPWQLCAQNLSKHTVVDSFHRSDNLAPDLALASAPKLKYACIPTLGQVLEANLAPSRRHNRKPGRLNRQLPPLSLIKRPLHLGFSLKRCLALLPWLLLPYATTTQALSAITTKNIQGSAPYLTFDNGVTRATTTEDIFWIALSDGTRITPTTNTSTTVNPIKLPVANQSFADIGMVVPVNADHVFLVDLVHAPYNYWGDDDGDGKGTDGITAMGYYNVSITDKYNNKVSRSDTLDICKAPYKVVLNGTNGSLTTKYGVPNHTDFDSTSGVTYYISPKAEPRVCYVQPYKYSSLGNFENIWLEGKGFLLQSAEPSSYSRNFPTTGANNLYFDLEVGGVKGSALTWSTVSQGGITATITPSPDNANNIRVTLTGPAATEAQHESATPGSVATPSLPQTFVLVGKDSSNNEVVRYGFVLKQWFVNRGDKKDYAPNHLSWCSNLGGGYRLSQVKDLTNAVRSGAVGATPSSPVNMLQRNIGAGFFSEWGYMKSYTAAGFFNSEYLTNETYQSGGGNIYWFAVNQNGGMIGILAPELEMSRSHGVCAYP